MDDDLFLSSFDLPSMSDIDKMDLSGLSCLAGNFCSSANGELEQLQRLLDLPMDDLNELNHFAASVGAFGPGDVEVGDVGGDPVLQSGFASPRQPQPPPPPPSVKSQPPPPPPPPPSVQSQLPPPPPPPRIVQLQLHRYSRPIPVTQAAPQPPKQPQQPPKGRKVIWFDQKDFVSGDDNGGLLSPPSLLNQLKTHSGNEEPTTGATFIRPSVSPTAENRQQQQQQQKQLFACSTCFRSYQSRSALREHRETAHRSRPALCLICARQLRSRHALVRHLESQHCRMTPRGPTLPFTCDLCRREFSDVDTLLRHRRRSLACCAAVTCSICLHKFMNAKALDRHRSECEKRLDLVRNSVSKLPAKLKCAVCKLLLPNPGAYLFHLNYISCSDQLSPARPRVVQRERPADLAFMRRLNRL